MDPLRKPPVYEHLVAEMSQYYSPQSGHYDISSLRKLPLVQSVQAETRRLRVATVVTHTNTIDGFQLDSHWALSRGSIATFFSRDFSLNEDLWSKARPRTVEKSLNDFWAQRFLVPDNTKASAPSEKQRKSKMDAGRFSLEGLEVWNSTVAENPLGREFADAIQTATVAVFLTQFELELCEPEAVDAAMPPLREVAYGTVKPLERVAVRIKKRRAERAL